MLPTPHNVDALLSIAREAGAMESADCHGAEMVTAVKQVASRWARKMRGRRWVTPDLLPSAY